MTYDESAKLAATLETWLHGEPARVREWRKAAAPQRLAFKRDALHLAQKYIEQAGPAEPIGEDAVVESVTEDLQDLHESRVGSIFTVVALAVLSEVIRWIVRRLLERRSESLGEATHKPA